MPADELQLRIPFVTLLKVALAVLLVVIIVKVWPVMLAIVIAVLIAVMLDPLVLWLEGHSVRRPIGVIALAFLIFGGLLLFLAFVAPVMGRQVTDLLRQLPRVVQRLASMFPALATLLAEFRTGSQQMEVLSARGLIAGKYIVEGITAAVFVLVVALYLLIDGRRTYAWLVSFVPARNRRRVDRTGREISTVVRSYLRGATIAATICAAYVLIVLTALHVPLALVLAVLAFVFDFVPVVGTIVMMIPATLLALLVSPARAIMVAAAYLLYHAIEAYVLLPRIYGHQMRVSTLTILLAMTIGAALQGVIGAVLALPLAAAYPIVERIWLREYLPEDTVPRHQELEETKT